MASIIDFEAFDDRNRRNAARNGKKIRQIYESAISEVSLAAGRIKINGQVFELSNFPALQKKVDSVVRTMQKQIYAVTVNGIKDGWQLSNDKNNLLVDRRIGKQNPSKSVRKLLYDPNIEGLKQFTDRREKGLNLSERVWKNTSKYKVELEKGLGVGVANGQSAREMAKDLKQYLNDPDRLFRRVRDAEGKLKLSAAAKAYSPGQGVYRSSYKNALRLSRTEQNMAYRTADHERWKTLPFIIGFRVKLSAAHPRKDICDHLVGKYPKTFKFVGWHPQCLCSAIPEMASDEEYDKMEDALLAGEPMPAAKQITSPPAGFTSFVQANKTQMDGWKSKPYWIKDNAAEVKKAVRATPPENADPSQRKYDLRPLLEMDGHAFKQAYTKDTVIPRLQKAMPEFSKEELAAIRIYGNTSYRNLNNFLRNPESLAGDLLKAERAYQENLGALLDQALDKVPVFKGTVYRGGNFSGKAMEAYTTAWETGEPVVEKAFTSTSREVGSGFGGDTWFIIESKNGKSVEKIMDFDGDNISEHEVLFKSNTKFKVTDIQTKTMKNSNGVSIERTVIRMTEL